MVVPPPAWRLRAPRPDICVVFVRRAQWWGTMGYAVQPGPRAQSVPMIAVSDLADSLGGGLLRVAVPQAGAEVDDITLAEPGSGVVGQPGDLVLGVGVDGIESAADLVGNAAAAGAGGVVLRRDLARRRAVRDSARRSGIALVELAEHASWAHVVWLLRGIIDRAVASPGPPTRAEGPVLDDLFSLADAAASLVDAPVTIEDAQSRVLAYSSRQEVTDPTRVSTIVGRRVPDEVLASLRARGVFRRMARSSEPFFVPPAPDGTRGRFVVPVRAGGEWLGSIWAVVDARPQDPVVKELAQAASVVALHLLRLRSQAELARRASADRLRTVLSGTTAGAEAWLPAGPWRAVALGAGESRDSGVREHLDLWESVCRRRSWHQPLLADLDGRAYAVVRDAGAAGEPGCWAWLRAVVVDVAAEDPALTAAAGSVATAPAALARSRAEALEVSKLIAAGRREGPVAALEEAWAGVTVERAAQAGRDHELLGPLALLRDHDAERGTAYLPTLAAWLDHRGEPAEAARQLHIHPNTLRYRMQRLSEAAPLELADPQARLALRVQLSALGL